MIYHSVYKPMIEEAYMQELHMVLKSIFLDTCVTPIGTRLNGSALDNTYAWNHTSMYLRVYLKSP